MGVTANADAGSRHQRASAGIPCGGVTTQRVEQPLARSDLNHYRGSLANTQLERFVKSNPITELVGDKSRIRPPDPSCRLRGYNGSAQLPPLHMLRVRPKRVARRRHERGIQGVFGGDTPNA